MKSLETNAEDATQPGFDILKLQRCKYAYDPNLHTLPVTIEGDNALSNALELSSESPVGRPGAVLTARDRWSGVLLSKLHLRVQASGKAIDPAMFRESISESISDLLNLPKTFSETAPGGIKHSTEENGGGM